jgi:hypothetical protein
MRHIAIGTEPRLPPGHRYWAWNVEAAIGNVSITEVISHNDDDVRLILGEAGVKKKQQATEERE